MVAGQVGGGQPGGGRLSVSCGGRARARAPQATPAQRRRNHPRPLPRPPSWCLAKTNAQQMRPARAVSSRGACTRGPAAGDSSPPSRPHLLRVRLKLDVLADAPKVGDRRPQDAHVALRNLAAEVGRGSVRRHGGRSWGSFLRWRTPRGVALDARRAATQQRRGVPPKKLNARVRGARQCVVREQRGWEACEFYAPHPPGTAPASR